MHWALRTIKDIVIIALFTVVGLAIIEGFLTLLYPQSTILMRAPNYLYTLRPNTTRVAHLSAVNGGNEIESRTNRWGFRGPDLDLRKHKPRIMLYGDSNIQAAFSPWERTLAARLGAWLASFNIDVEVVNAGVDGYGPDQVALRLKEEISYWQPDVVIVHIFADNDLGDLIRNNLFRFDDSGQAYVNPEGSLDWPDWLTRSRIYRAAARVAGSLNDQPTYETEAKLAGLTRLNDEDLQSYRSNKRRIGQPDHYDLDVALDPRADSSQLKLKLFDHVIKYIKDIVNKHSNAQLLFLIQPSSRDVSTNLSPNHREFAQLSPHYGRRNLSDLIETAIVCEGLAYINLFDDFVTDEMSPYYFSLDDDHWNDAGQDKAAKIVARFLVDQGLVRAATKVQSAASGAFLGSGRASGGDDRECVTVAGR